MMEAHNELSFLSLFCAVKRETFRDTCEIWQMSLRMFRISILIGNNILKVLTFYHVPLTKSFIEKMVFVYLFLYRVKHNLSVYENVFCVCCIIDIWGKSSVDVLSQRQILT